MHDGKLVRCFTHETLPRCNIRLDIKTTNRTALLKAFKADTEARKRVLDVKST